MYQSLDELTHEKQMIAEYGECFAFLDRTHTSNGLKYVPPYQVYQTFINAIPASDAVQFIDSRGRYAIVHRCTRHAGKWQASYFDSKGAYGDSVRDTRDAAIIAALEMGFDTIKEVF